MISEEELALRRVLGALVKRMGGTVAIDEDEIDDDPKLVLDFLETSDSIVVHLLPDFVHVEEVEPFFGEDFPPLVPPPDLGVLETLPFKYLGLDPGNIYVGTRPDLYVDNSDSFRGGTISASPWRSIDEQREPPPGKSFLDGIP